MESRGEEEKGRMRASGMLGLPPYLWRSRGATTVVEGEVAVVMPATVGDAVREVGKVALVGRGGNRRRREGD